jgi:hypothetical protein
LIVIFRYVTVFAPESLDSSRSIDQLLLAGKKRMAAGADFHRYVFYRRPGFKAMPAGAFYGGLEIFRMYFWFQGFLPN